MAEYVTNGTFDTDIIGWTDNSTGNGSVSWSASYGGSAKLDCGANPAFARMDQQLAATVAGVQYSVSFYVETGNGAGHVEIGTSSGDDSLLSVAYQSSGAYSGTFVASGATTWIGLNLHTSELSNYLDDVSVQEDYSGGIWQSQKGLARITDPTLKMGDVAYRELIRAKANANNVDPTLANLYTYIVNAHEGISDCSLSDPVSTDVSFNDGDMELSTATDWIQARAAVITKETGTPYGGTQVLRVAYGGTTVPYTYQNSTMLGHRYHLRGWARGDGTWSPLIVDSGVTLWTGTSSTDWQLFDITYTAAGTNIRFGELATGAGYTEWDDITLDRVYGAGDEILAQNNGVVDVGIYDDEIMYQGERNRLQVYGPRAGGMVNNVVNWTYEYLPFVVDLNAAGDWSINDSTIDSLPSKILTCDTADHAVLPSFGYFGGEAAATLAYGEWEWWIYKSAAGAPIVMPIASVAELPSNSSQDGYSVAISAAGALSLNEVSSGAATPVMTTAAATISDITWTKITLTRSAANAFTVYINDTAATADTGSNPVTDATTTESYFMVLDFDAGDQVGLEHFEDDIKLFTYDPL